MDDRPPRGPLRGGRVRKPERRAGGDAALADLGSRSGWSPGPLGKCCIGVVLLLFVLAAPLRGQSGTLQADAGFSHALPPPSDLDIDASTYLLLGLRADGELDLRTSLYASLYGGMGVESASGDWISLTVGGTTRRPLSENLSAGVEARVNAFTVGDPLSYRAMRLELFPDVGMHLEGADLFFRGRLGLGRSTVEAAGTPEGGRPPIGGEIVEPTEVSTGLWYVGGGPELRVPVGEMSADIVAAAYRSSGGESYLQGGVDLTGDLDLRGGAETLSWTLQLDVWDTPVGAEVSGGVTLSLPLGPGWSARANGGRSDPGPLLRSPPGVHGSAVVTRTLATLRESGAESVYTLERRDGGALARFSLVRPEAERVSLVGDFSDWEPVPLQRRDGRWTGEMQVSPGLYHYGFLVDGEWFVPEHASGRVSDEYGQVNATLVIPSGDG